LKITSNRIRFIDTQGIYRVVFGCPLRQRELLRDTLGDLSDHVQSSPYKTIAELYDHDLEWQAIAHHALSLCKIDPDWLDIDMLSQFLLPYEQDGKPKDCLLQSLNFPETKAAGGKGSTYEEIIAATWSHTGTLEAALQALGYDPGDALGWAELQAVLEARNKMADPERAEEEEAIAAMGHDANLGFNGSREATPEETAAILAGI
jgi:hypothetical protein